MRNDFYTLQATNLKGEETPMSTYKNKIILVVNTASNCGLAPQFKGLEELYQKYKNRDFIILGFPCNQFANQEPGNKESIREGCRINYGVTFPMFSKVEVNGENTHPIFKFLKERLGGLFGSRIKWNFTKFLIDSSGKPVKRFSPLSKPNKIDKHIKKLM